MGSGRGRGRPAGEPLGPPGRAPRRANPWHAFHAFRGSHTAVEPQTTAGTQTGPSVVPERRASRSRSRGHFHRMRPVARSPPASPRGTSAPTGIADYQQLVGKDWTMELALLDKDRLRDTLQWGEQMIEMAETRQGYEEDALLGGAQLTFSLLQGAEDRARIPGAAAVVEILKDTAYSFAIMGKVMCRMIELMDHCRCLGALPQPPSLPQPVPEPVPQQPPAQRDYMPPAATCTPDRNSDGHDGAPDDKLIVYAQEEAACQAAQAPSTIGSSTPPPRTPSPPLPASPTAPGAPAHGYPSLAEGLVTASDTFPDMAKGLREVAGGPWGGPRRER